MVAAAVEAAEMEARLVQSFYLARRRVRRAKAAAAASATNSAVARSATACPRAARRVDLQSCPLGLLLAQG